MRVQYLISRKRKGKLYNVLHTNLLYLRILMKVEQFNIKLCKTKTRHVFVWGTQTAGLVDFKFWSMIGCMIMKICFTKIWKLYENELSFDTWIEMNAFNIVADKINFNLMSLTLLNSVYFFHLHIMGVFSFIIHFVVWRNADRSVSGCQCLNIS